MDQIIDRFRLSQVDSLIEKSAHTEFTRLGQFCAERGKQSEQLGHNNRTAVTRDFNYIFAGKGMWRFKVGDDRFVDDRTGFRIDDLIELSLIRYKRCSAPILQQSTQQ